MPFCCWKIELSWWTRDVLPSVFSAGIFPLFPLDRSPLWHPTQSKEYFRNRSVKRRCREPKQYTSSHFSLSRPVYLVRQRWPHIILSIWSVCQVVPKEVSTEVLLKLNLWVRRDWRTNQRHHFVSSLYWHRTEQTEVSVSETNSKKRSIV